VRCDGDERTGAGHVARCVPVAVALRFHGWQPVFVGGYSGLARWLVERAGISVRAPVTGGCCGLHPDEWDAAIVDLYGAPEAELCALARRLPVATMAEASRCPEAGVRVDYHLDRTGDDPSARELPGPAFAPLDPALPAHRRAPGREVRTALVATGGSTFARRIAVEAIAALRATFPGVHVIAGSGVASDPAAETLPFPGTLHTAIARADVAVSGAGLTAYELACAGVPAVLVGVADNQRRVLEGSRRAGTAVVGGPADSIPGAVGQLADAAVRGRIARSGVARFDGVGAPRTAAALDNLWRGGDVGDVVLRPAAAGDRDRLLAWRNDALTREASFRTAAVSEPDHDRWLAQSLARPDRRLMVAEQAGTPVAQLRLDRDPDPARAAEVSITVAPECRGRGLGPAVLAAADTAARDWGVEWLIARIKPSNVRSRRIFESAGYVEDAEPAGEELVLHKPPSRRGGTSRTPRASGGHAPRR
jgi:RimJ/RimL family protein N-acetyltransferase/spore coat polysaccharide biosynthesis predicted glycosyltransferase SpsG